MSDPHRQGAATTCRSWSRCPRRSAKAADLVRRPAAALTFYWIALARQVRITGAVEPAPADESARDYLARSAGARAAALVGRQSEALTSRAELEAAVAAAERQIADDPGVVDPHWRLYNVRAESVEFWQADRDRRHIRLRYDRSRPGWTKSLLWP